ncbi:hypothetical protein BX616_005884 [Lobosporangium transversale]|nr:hypothetical protein BX616_005884 [Lobosporangium transversale]
MTNLLSMSPHSEILKSRTFVELTDSMCELLNRDWEFRPQFKFACAQLLAGSILLNCNNNEAVMLNTVESYGRTKDVDAHREPFGTIKGVAIPTTLSPPTKTRYKDVWPTTHASTYLLCRASGHITRSLTCRPYTVFTLSKFDQNHSGNAMIWSDLSEYCKGSSSKREQCITSDQHDQGFKGTMQLRWSSYLDY